MGRDGPDEGFTEDARGQISSEDRNDTCCMVRFLAMAARLVTSSWIGDVGGCHPLRRGRVAFAFGLLGTV